VYAGVVESTEVGAGWTDEGVKGGSRMGGFAVDEEATASGLVRRVRRKEWRHLGFSRRRANMVARDRSTFAEGSAAESEARN
jgi:hypothetical protein